MCWQIIEFLKFYFVLDTALTRLTFTNILKDVLIGLCSVVSLKTSWKSPKSPDPIVWMHLNQQLYSLDQAEMM